MATPAEVRLTALQMLQVVPIGDTAKAEDEAKAENYYTWAYNDLKKDGLATWTVEGTIPDEAVPHLAAMMAFHGAEDYSVSDQRYQRILLKNAGAKRELRRLLRHGYQSVTEPADY